VKAVQSVSNPMCGNTYSRGWQHTRSYINDIMK